MTGENNISINPYEAVILVNENGEAIGIGKGNHDGESSVFPDSWNREKETGKVKE